MYTVEIQEGCWLADWDGDPGRTVVLNNAKQFKTIIDAEKALSKARHYKPFKGAVINRPK